MEGQFIKELFAWKENKNRKLLVIRGARQVGKAWLIKRFSKDMDTEHIIMGIELYSNINIDSQNILIIFDEIQEAPQAFFVT